MSNKAKLNMEAIDKRTILEVYDTLLSLDVQEMMDILIYHGNVCKASEISVLETGDKITVSDTKLGVIGTFNFEDGEWIATDDSKLTYEEYKTYTDPSVVEVWMDHPANQAAYGERAIPPKGLIPPEAATEIFCRGTVAHGFVKKYLSGAIPKPTIKAEEVSRLISVIGNSDKTRILSILPTKLGNIKNSPGSFGEKLDYEDFLVQNAIGADKITHALCVGIWTIQHERKVLLDSDHTNRAELREKIVQMGARYTEALRKIMEKISLGGKGKWMCISNQVAVIREDLANRPMFFTD